MTTKIKQDFVCIFCGKDLTDEKFRIDYTLVAVQDDQDEPDSLNKIAKPVHNLCLNKFKELNNYDY